MKCKFNISIHYLTRFPRITQEEVNLLKASDHKPDCSICTEEIRYIRKLNCGHSFHLMCLTKWIENGKKSCPLCRKDIVSKNKKSIFYPFNQRRSLNRIEAFNNANSNFNPARRHNVYSIVIRLPDIFRGIFGMFSR